MPGGHVHLAKGQRGETWSASVNSGASGTARLWTETQMEKGPRHVKSYMSTFCTYIMTQYNLHKTRGGQRGVQSPSYRAFTGQMHDGNSDIFNLKPPFTNSLTCKVEQVNEWTAHNVLDRWDETMWTPWDQIYQITFFFFKWKTSGLSGQNKTSCKFVPKPINI